jgi:tripartite-type tricarboxylate transporter receptor subunit TctC
MKRMICRAVAALAIGCAAITTAAGQNFPNKPVRFVVPYAAGGSGDLLARLIGEKLSQKWGQQVVVDDRPGAGGLIGTEFAARSDPDGYTIYLATDGPTTVAATLHKKVPYDWKRDLMPISLMAVGYQVLIVSPKFPAKTLQEFIALVKKEPGKYNMASIGLGSPPHLAAELFQAQAGIRMTHVPYRGSSAQAITALIAGDVSAFIVGTSSAVQFIQNGQLRGLAVASPQRLTSLPDVPTFAESGLPDFDYSLWFAVLAPRGVPADIVRKLNADIAAVVADPDYRKTLDLRGFEAKSDSPEELGALMDKDFEKNRTLIQKLGLSID